MRADKSISNQFKSLLSFPSTSSIHGQNDLVDIVAKMVKRYRIATKIMQSTIPKQSIPTHPNDNNEHTINEQSLRPQSITNPNHCLHYENDKMPRKKPSLQWSITSFESQQIINCDITVKVNIRYKPLAVVFLSFSHIVIDHIHRTTSIYMYTYV